MKRLFWLAISVFLVVVVGLGTCSVVIPPEPPRPVPPVPPIPPEPVPPVPPIPPDPEPQEEIGGTCIGVVSSSMFRISQGLFGRKTILLRGLESPDPEGKHFKPAKQFLARWIENRRVDIVVYDYTADAFIGDGTIGGFDVTSEVLRAGWGRLQVGRGTPAQRNAEQEARREQRGIWKTEHEREA